MRVLVTGGAGFIGSNFVHYSLQNFTKDEIVVLDKLTYAANFENIKGLLKNRNFKFIKGDICNRKLIEKILKEGVDAIINFAAETHVDRSIGFPSDFVNTNIVGTFTLLDAARKFDVDKFEQISTDEVYGSSQLDSFKETDRFNPSSPYAASKAAADELVHSYWITYKLPVVITRSTNNYGPYQHLEKFIPKMITNIINNISLPIYGDGQNIRSWIFVLDNCAAIKFVLDNAKLGEIYNVCGKNELANIEIVRLILKEMKKSESMIRFVKDRPGHDRRYSLDCDKLKKLGWQSKTEFNDGIRKTINWYLENESLWKKLENPNLEKIRFG